MLTLISRLASRPGIFLSMLVASMMLNVLALAQPIFVIQVLNRYVAHGVDATLMTLSTGTLIAVVLEFGFRQVRMRFANVIALKPDEQTSMSNFRTMLSARLSALEQSPAGLRREFLSGADAVAQAFSGPNIATLLDLPFALMYLGVLYLLSPQLAGIASVFAFIVLLAGIFGTHGVGAATGAMIKQSGEGGRHIGSVIKAAETVRVFNARPFLMHVWQIHTRRAQALARLISGKRGFIQSLTQTATAAQGIAIIAAGAVLVVRQELDVGAMIGANILAARALSTVARYAALSEGLGKARQQIRLFQEFQRLPAELETGAALGDYHGGLAFKDVSFFYPGSSTPLFETLDLDLKPGSVLLVSGTNGAGKTTLCKLLAGLIEPKRGEILADGVDLRQIVPEWWHQQICYLPQEPTFLNATIAENLSTLDPEIEPDGLNRIIERAALKPFISESRDGFNTMIVDNGATLSLGIRRRLALARALVTDGRLVIFDEPTEALDEQGRQAVYDILNDMSKEGRTIVVCSSDPNIMQAAQFALDLNQKPVPRIVPNPAHPGIRRAESAPETHQNGPEVIL